MQARTLPWLVASGVAHGALAMLFTRLRWEELPPAVFAPVEVTLFEPARTEPVVAEPARSEPAVAEAAPVRKATRAAAPVAPPTPEPLAIPEPVLVPSFVLPTARAAALSAIELEPGGILDAGTPRGPRRDEDELALEGKIMAAAGRVDTRDIPKLHPRAGGGYNFRGNGFSAVIEPDGSVRMADNFRDAAWIFKPSAGEDGLAAGFKFFSMKFDIFKRIDRALGNDPFQSERRWFLDSTRDLRESMAAHYLDQRVHSRRDE